MSTIKVSVCCLTYNHAKYVRQCLDGFIMQKTNFKFEVLIHDDASTDGTQDIIREYEEKYPDIIKPIYQTENQYSKGKKIIINYIYPIAKGSYIAFCEGDDYWTDEYKLQKQYDIMEKNLDCYLCVHRVRAIDESGLVTKYCIPRDYELDFFKDNKIIKSDSFIDYFCKKNECPFQTTSYFMRMNMIKGILDSPPEFMTVAGVGDVPMLLLSVCYGNIYYIDEIMSNYRTSVPNSWSRRRSDNDEFLKKTIYNSIIYVEKFNEFTNYKYDSSINYYLLKHKYILEILNKNYKAVFNQDYRKVVNDLSFKAKAFHYIRAISPRVVSAFKSITSKIIGKNRK